MRSPDSSGTNNVSSVASTGKEVVMKLLLLVGLALTLASCATAPSPSPMGNVAEPVAFLNGLRNGQDGTCTVTEFGKVKRLPCVTYPGPQGSSVIAVRDIKGVLLWISWVKADGTQKVLWARQQRVTPLPGIQVA